MKSRLASLLQAGFPGQFMVPMPFFIGIMLGFATCCFMGFNCLRTNPFENFERFHYFISQYSSYYPTVNEMMALATSEVKDGQTLVIVGGDSVFNGMGQSVDNLWTKKLQEKLGDEFHVVNLAMHGGSTFEGAYYVAESLIRKAKRVIFVTNTQPAWAGPIEGYQLASICFSAIHRDLLFQLDVRKFLIENDLANFSTGPNDQRLSEMDLGSRIDSFINAWDLWHMIGYKNVFSIWDKETHPRFWRARREFPDKEVIKVPGALSEENRRIRAEELKRRYLDLLAEGQHTEKPQAWDKFDEMIKRATPEGVRQYMLIVLPRSNPLVLGELSEEERENDRATYVIASQKWMGRGYNALVFGDDLKSEDYCDSNHFSNSGGAKLATEVAIAVKIIAVKRGYFKL